MTSKSTLTILIDLYFKIPSLEKKDMRDNTKIFPDLMIASKHLYEPNGLILDAFAHEAEGEQYCAAQFKLHNKLVKFRNAKITPIKAGQFVTIWKRIDDGPIMPFAMTDRVDFFMISVRQNQQLGQFIFPKSVLYEKGYLSKNGKGGKRAIRVYPPWDDLTSDIARKTQEWQLKYFVEITSEFVQNAKLRKLIF